MNLLHAGYCSAAILDRLQKDDLNSCVDWYAVLHHHSHAVISQSLVPEPHPDPLAVLLINLLTRGLPTLPSIALERTLTDQTNLIDVNLAGVSEDTSCWETQINRPFEDLRLLIEQALYPLDPSFQSGAAAGFEMPPFGSEAERAFFHGPLTQALGPVLQLVELQRPLTSIVVDKRFERQQADFCIEFHGASGNQPKGVVIELDGAQHSEKKQKELDRKRDAACQKAGWIVIRVPTSNPTQLLDDPGLALLRAHPCFKIMESQSENPLLSTDIGRSTLELIQLPFGIARLQVSLLQHILTGQLSFRDEKWRICAIERDLHCAESAFEDLQTWIQALFDLYQPKQRIPKFELSIADYQDIEALENAANKGREHPFDIVFDQAVLSTYGSASTSVTDIATKSYLSIRRGFRSVVDYQLATTDTLLPPLPQIEEKQLRFFLHNLFRKNSFREKQFEIVDRALRQQSTIALLPTGAGKSLTYQLSALLSNGVVLIIDPIKSLMKDQVDSLTQIGIDCTAFINSTMSAADRQVELASKVVYKNGQCS